jgi:hypothetical protein
MIFDKYITDLYQIKENSAKGSALYLISKLLMNSLFGRMGMNPFLPKSKFLTTEDYNQAINENKIDVLEVDTKHFKNHVLVVLPNKDKDYSECDGNVSIALAITAYSRILMSSVKNNPNITLYYTDTDSAFTDEYLPADLVDPKKLGYWSLEDEYLYCIFIGPKTYGCLNTEGQSYSKVKGYNSKVSLADLDALLNENEVKHLSQDKWKRFLVESKISIKSTTYDLVVTDNKKRISL